VARCVPSYFWLGILKNGRFWLRLCGQRNNEMSVTVDGRSLLWIALRSHTRIRLDELSTPPAVIRRLGENESACRA
jgi:hypothetical protein